MVLKLAYNIRSFRKDLGLTQQQLADFLSVSVGVVSKWELALSSPDIDMLVRIAAFFNTSVDVLIGYEASGNSARDFLNRFNEYDLKKERDSALKDAEMAMKLFPNNFTVMNRASQIMGIIGHETKDDKILQKSVNGYKSALKLIDQNEDPEISSFTINNEISYAYLSMNKLDLALEHLKNNNPSGINDSIIGYSISDIPEKSEEAYRYLHSAFLKNISELVRIVFGLLNVMSNNKKYKEGIEICNWILPSLEKMVMPDSTGITLTIRAIITFILSSFQYITGDEASAIENIKKACAMARKYDSNPISSFSNIKFLYPDPEIKNIAYVTIAETSVQALQDVAKSIDGNKREAFMKLLEETLNERQS